MKGMMGRADSPSNKHILAALEINSRKLQHGIRVYCYLHILRTVSLPSKVQPSNEWHAWSHAKANHE